MINAKIAAGEYTLVDGILTPKGAKPMPAGEEAPKDEPKITH